MVNMRIKDASFVDKEKVLEFCKNTFSWGDYIAEVWDHWVKEGTFLVAHQDDKPIAICHALITPLARQVWIEGIRTHPNYRKKGFAKFLIKKAENIAKIKNSKLSYMLIDTTNSNSLRLAKGCNYKILETWYFYSLIPQNHQFKYEVQEASFEKKSPKILFSKSILYVKSWRWLPLDSNTLQELIAKKQIIFIEKNKKNTIAILTDSEHFDGTLMITLIDGTSNGIKDILSYLQKYSFKKNYKRVQILTKIKDIQNFEGLEKRLTFFLLQKDLE